MRSCGSSSPSRCSSEARDVEPAIDAIVDAMPLDDAAVDAEPTWTVVETMIIDTANSQPTLEILALLRACQTTAIEIADRHGGQEAEHRVARIDPRRP
jgi:hypothetical protein